MRGKTLHRPIERTPGDLVILASNRDPIGRAARVLRQGCGDAHARLAITAG
jgi:hypothetical protein